MQTVHVDYQGPDGLKRWHATRKVAKANIRETASTNTACVLCELLNVKYPGGQHDHIGMLGILWVSSTPWGCNEKYKERIQRLMNHLARIPEKRTLH